MRWCPHITPELRTLRREDRQLEASPGYSGTVIETSRCLYKGSLRLIPGSVAKAWSHLLVGLHVEHLTPGGGPSSSSICPDLGKDESPRVLSLSPSASIGFPAFPILAPVSWTPGDPKVPSPHLPTAPGESPAQRVLPAPSETSP